MAEEIATLETYESTLRDVVNGKRLSASKMTKLTDIAMRLLENDTQLVSILYRTHKSLPTPSAKISSLYAFDALCRAARSQVVKKGVTPDSSLGKGNAATFLLKVEGVLDGLVQDMVSSGSTEVKDKTKKVLDIWTKSNTFPSDVLKRLMEQAKVKETTNQIAKTSDPRTSRAAPTDVTPPASTPPSATTPAPDSAQQALLALLTSAAASGQTPTNIINAGPSNPVAAVTPTQPQLDPLQLALLQQLANKVNVNVGSVPVALGQGQSSSVPAVLPHVVPQLQQLPIHQASNIVANIMSNHPSTARSPPHSESHPNSDRRDPRLALGGPSGHNGGTSTGVRHDDGPSHPYSHHRGDEFDDKRNFRDDAPARGSYRGTRDDYRAGRLGDRGRDLPNYRDTRNFDQRDEREQSPLRRKRSRSRSPHRDRDRERDWDRDKDRYNRRGPGPYSPPHRPPLAQGSPSVPHSAKITEGSGLSEKGRPPAPGALQAGKDEFGRDIRQTSEEAADNRASGVRQRSLSTDKGNDTITMDLVNSGSTRVSVDPASKAASGNAAAVTPTPNGTADASQSKIADSNGSGGLDTFDFTAFNPMSAESWVSLGKAFEFTNGYSPSQEELMMLVSGGMMAFAQMYGMGVGDMDTSSAVEQGMGGGQWSGAGQQQWGGSYGNSGRGRGFQQRGGGNFGRGRGGMMQQQWSEGRFGNSSFDKSTSSYTTDAIVLGGSSGDTDVQGGDYGDGSMGGDGDLQSPGGTGGSMRKVGDRWMFVRESATS